VRNAIKAVPWLLLVDIKPAAWALMAVSLLAVPTGIRAGWRLHQRRDQLRMYRVYYGLLVVTALKLSWDGVSGCLR
jgi:hypothetical protein